MRFFFKKLLTESIESKDRNDIYLNYVKDFVKFAKQYLGIKGRVKIKLQDNKDGIETTAVFNIKDISILIYAKNRSLIDIARSIFHELSHQKQLEDGKINDSKIDGEDGSPLENEANAKAGEMVRRYGKIKPEIYTL